MSVNNAIINLKLDSKGYIRNRESHILEYKQNFQQGDNLLKYIKTLVGMANNKGGYIVFGVKNSPHIPLGMTNSRLQNIDPKDIESKIREHFEPSIKWDFGTFMLNEKELGYIHVEESEIKPVVCQKNKNEILREGAIYYRYRGETREIAYPELRKLLDSEREKERIMWIKHIEKIAIIGPRNVHLLDSYKGEISVGDGKIVIDKNILDKISFIKEGHFTEKDDEGLPTLRLIGDIDGVVETDKMLPPDVVFPYTTKDLMTKLHLNQFQWQAVLFHYKIKEKPKYHTEISNGKNSIHKYSENLFTVLSRIFNDKPDILDDCVREFKQYQKDNKKTRSNHK